MTTLKTVSIVTVGATFIALGTVSKTQAATIGGQLFSTGENVEVQIIGAAPHTAFTSTLYLFSPTNQYIGTNWQSGKVVNLGSFPVGQELVFGIFVQNTGNTFLMGPGFRNADGVAHAAVSFLTPEIANVAFEDLWGGGDRSYDDNIFQFRGGISPTPPVPPTLTGFTLNGIDSNITITEGQSVSATFFATDPDVNAIAFWLNGSLISQDFNTSGTRTVSTDLGVFPDEGIFTYTGQAGDSTTITSNSLMRTVNVLNANPLITSLTQDLMGIPTGMLFDFAATATDPGLNDVLAYSWDFNDDGLYNDFTGSSGQWSFSKPGIHSVKLQVSDDDGGFAYGSFNVEAKHVPEPTSVLGLLAFTAVGFGSLQRRKNSSKILMSTNLSKRDCEYL